MLLEGLVNGHLPEGLSLQVSLAVDIFVDVCKGYGMMAIREVEFMQ